MLLSELDASKVDLSSAISYSDVFLLSCFIKRGKDVLVTERCCVEGSWVELVFFTDISNNKSGRWAKEGF